MASFSEDQALLSQEFTTLKMYFDKAQQAFPDGTFDTIEHGHEFGLWISHYKRKYDGTHWKPIIWCKKLSCTINDEGIKKKNSLYTSFLNDQKPIDKMLSHQQ